MNFIRVQGMFLKSIHCSPGKKMENIRMLYIRIMPFLPILHRTEVPILLMILFCLYADAPFKTSQLTISASFISITISYEKNGD